MFYFRLQLAKVMTGLSSYEISFAMGYSISYLSKIESFQLVPSYKVEKALERFIERSLGREALAYMDKLIKLAYEDKKAGTENEQQ